MDASLFWTALGTVIGALGLLVAYRQQALLAWQDRGAAHAEHRPVEVAGRSVHVPTGQLPPVVRGRDPLLRELHRRRRRPAGTVVVLAGMGGIGKSTVATALAERVQHTRLRWRRPCVWWVSAADPASLAGGLVTVARQLGGRQVDVEALGTGAPDAADRLWDLLERAPRGWLLILDNADDPAVLTGSTGWLRSTSRGLVVVTSRVADPAVWGRHAHIHRLASLDQVDAAQVLLDRAPGAGDPAQAQQLASRLGCLPLALDLVGSYLESEVALRASFHDCWQALDDRGIGPRLLLPDQLPDAAADARRLVTRTWEMSLDALARAGVPQARPLLRLLCCYASATPIPLALLRPDRLGPLLTREDDGGRPLTATEAERRLDRGLRQLGLLSLIEVRRLDTAGGRDRALAVHPLVADTNRVHLKDNTPDHRAGNAHQSSISVIAIDLVAAALGVLTVDRGGDWPAYHLLSSHLYALLDTVAGHLDRQQLRNLVRVTGTTVDKLNRIGAIPAGERLARAALGLLDSNEPADLWLRHHLAWIAAVQGRPAEAEKMLTDVLAVRLQVFGKDHPETLDTRQELAWVAAVQGRWAEAEKAYRKVIACRRRVIGEDHRHTLITRHELGWAVANQGRAQEAEELLRAVLADRRRVFGDEHADTLDTLHELAWVTADQGRWAEAEKAYRDTLDLHRRVLGDNHWKTLVVRHELAWTIAEQGRHRAALREYQVVLAARRRALGEDHPDTEATRQALDRLRRGHPTPARHLA